MVSSGSFHQKNVLLPFSLSNLYGFRILGLGANCLVVVKVASFVHESGGGNGLEFLLLGLELLRQ